MKMKYYIPQDLAEKYKDYSHRQLLETVDHTRAIEWCHPSIEDIASSLGIPWSYSSDLYDVPFLIELDSAIVWTCTDTGVGISYLFLLEDDGVTRTPIGFTQQKARKDDKYHFFFSDEYQDLVAKKLMQLIKPDMSYWNKAIDINDKVLED